MVTYGENTRYVVTCGVNFSVWNDVVKLCGSKGRPLCLGHSEAVWMKGPAEFISWAPLKIVQLEQQLGPGDAQRISMACRGTSWHGKLWRNLTTEKLMTRDLEQLSGRRMPKACRQRENSQVWKVTKGAEMPKDQRSCCTNGGAGGENPKRNERISHKLWWISLWKLLLTKTNWNLESVRTCTDYLEFGITLFAWWQSKSKCFARSKFGMLHRRTSNVRMTWNPVPTPKPPNIRDIQLQQILQLLLSLVKCWRV